MMLPEYMATCVHVVATALGLKTVPTEIPKTTIIFDFPLVEAGRQLYAEVVIWDIDKDIAGLRVIDALPDGVLPCLPQQGEDLWEHRFRAFGFPENNGVWIRGSLLATETSGRLQLEVDRLTGYAVAPGFSGGPVWDDTLDSLVGLIATADLRETIRTAFVIPAQQLFAAWPELSQVRLETDLTPVQADMIQPQPTAERGELHESLLGAEQSVYGGRNVQIAISQMFRMADLLTRPQSVKARSFYDAITDVSRMRRVLNARTGFDLGNLGLLRPVIRICERYDKFWTPAIPDLRMVDHDNCPLYFIPYELKLSERLADCPIAIPFVEPVEQSMQNLQIDARLRIYPPGTGVIRIGLTVQFKELVNISTLSRLASDIENLFFVDPEGNQKPHEDFFLDAIEEVSNTIFVNEGYSYEQRCWMPPVTEYSLKGETTLVPEVEIDNLAQVLYLAPGSEDSLQDLVEHVKGALKSPLWQKNRILAVPTQGIALFILDGGNIRGSEQRGRNILGWLRETREIIMAALYAHKAFTEEIERLYFTQELNDTWLPPTSKFLYLASLLQTMLKVIQAIGSIRLHLHRQGGSMMPFAQDLWLSSNLPDYESCDIGLEYILDWLLKAQSACDSESIDSLISTVRKIKAIPRLFS